MNAKEKIEREESWQCVTCKDGKNMTRGETLHHLQEIHKIKTPFTGERSMTMHIDGAKEYSSFYEWKINNIKLTQAVTES